MTDPVEPPEVVLWNKERFEARRLLKAALLDLEVDAPNGAYMPGELPDEIRAFLAGTTTEEPNL